MPINPNIALGVQQQQPVNMLGQLGQIYALKGAKQEFEGNEALREAYAQGGDLNDPAFRQRVMAANPKLGSQLIKTSAETSKLQNEAVAKRIELSREMLTGINTPEDYLAWHESNHRDPVLGSYLSQRGVTAEDSRAKIMAELGKPGGLERLKRESALGAGKLQQELMQTERSVQVANIGAAAPLMNARLNREKFDLEQTQQSDVAKILQRGTPTNALAPTGAAAASVNALATPPSDIYSEISNIDAQIRQLVSSGNPKAIAAAQVLNAQRTQLLQSAKQEFGGNQIPVETTGPDGRPITVMMRPNRYGVNVPVETAPLPLSTDASATGGTGISPTVARPAPTAAVLKERQAAERLPEAIAMNNDAIRKIDEMIGGVDAKGNPLPGAKGKPHPGFTGAVGFGLGAQYIPGTDARGFKARHEEVLGQAFLDAFEALKGGGAITEIEGQKATAARTRMNLATSEKEYMDAAREYQGVLKRGIENARSRIQRSGGTPPPSSGTPSSIDALLDKYK